MSETRPTMTVRQIGEAMFACEHARMTKEQTQIMVFLTMLEGRAEPVPDDMMATFPFQVIKKRLEWFSEFRKSMEFDKSDTPIASDCLIMMCAMVSDRVGMAVLYAAAIAAMYMKNQQTVTMQSAFMHFFPDGFPTEEAIGKIWAQQKIGSGNSVDTAEAWYWDHDVPIYHVDTAEQAIDMLKNLTEKK